jgi:hypothetical protein
MPKGRASSVVMDSRSAGGPVETVWSLMAELKAQQGLPAAMCTPSAPRIQAAAILRACSSVPTPRDGVRALFARHTAVLAGVVAAPPRSASGGTLSRVAWDRAVSAPRQHTLTSLGRVRGICAAEAKGARGAPLRPPLRRPRAVQPEGVSLDVFDAAGVLGDSREASLVAASAVGVLAAAHDGAVPPKSVAEEVARHQAVAALSRRFSELCEERLGKKVHVHPTNRQKGPLRDCRHRRRSGTSDADDFTAVGRLPASPRRCRLRATGGCRRFFFPPNTSAVIH